MLKFYCMTVLAVLAALLGAYGYGRQAGQRAVEIKQQREVEKLRRTADNVKKRINTLPDSDVRAGLRDWTRD